MSDIADQTTLEDTATGAINFILSDLDTPAADLRVSGSSSNPTLLPDANIIFGGSDSNRSVTLLPASNQFGATTITLTVSDDSLSASKSFLLTVTPVNDPPWLEPIAKILLGQNSGSQMVLLRGISCGPLNEIQGLSFAALSDNPGLVPNPEVTYSSPEDTGSLTLAPLPDAIGTAVITVTLRDDGGLLNAGLDSIVRSFTVEVLSPPILRIARAGEAVNITFDTAADVTYVVECKNSAADSGWTTLQSIAGTGGMVTIPESTQDAVSRFYRVRAQ
jgi:hypothetical protein